ncbi:MAG: AAA family ATPase, partial [Campylobacterota bacterium]|nr:AAA family ATPase [Campylobacterota bacterium]
MKKIPYGQADYKSIKENNYYLIDKTKFIEKLENLNERYLIFLRPRRFGKSLFISMLHYYYDVNYKDNFETLYGDTYIGK